MLLRALVVFAQIAVVTACGGAGAALPGALPRLPLLPTPLPQGQWLQPGRYSINISGADFQAEPFRQICSPAGSPPAGKTVRTEVDLVADGNWLVGRAVGGDVDLEIRLRDGGAGSVRVEVA